MNAQTDILGEKLVLHPSGAIWWPTKGVLLLADLHLGKVTHFRKNGSAIPLAAMEENYRKLDAVLKAFDPIEVVFLGDLFHSNLNREWERFETWAIKQTATLTLVEGNHDIISPHRYESLGVEVCAKKRLERFLLTHHPTLEEGYFNFCGHIHPAIRMSGAGKQRLKLACFFQTAAQMILPAFGTFTGKHLLSPGPEDKLFVLADQEVIAVSPQKTT